jgi:hypothetical protein
LEEIEKPCDDGKDSVEGHGPVNQVFEGFGSGEAKIEQ